MNRSQRITGARKALRDYHQYLKSPIPGTKIFPLESNIKEFHVNTKVPEGPYKDIVIHWILTIAEEYPFRPPFGQMPDGILIKHEHIYQSGFCNNFLQNFEYMNKSSGSFDGWTPGCTFESLMLAMKTFFVDHDLPNYRMVGARNEALRIFEHYQCRDCGSHGEVFEENVATERETGLTCQVSHLSFKDDPQMILGYPINITFRRSNLNETDILKIRLPDIELFPEMISYESYMTSLSIKLSGESHNMRTPLGHEYNNWIPIYLNDRHYNISKKYIYTILSTICYGERGSDRYDYRPQMFIKVYPAILNGIVVGISKCKSYESDALILAFTNVLKTFLHAVRVENVERANSRIVERFIVQNRRSKKDTPNLGEWLFNLAASSQFKLDQSVPIVLKEMFPRLCFWISKDPQNPFDLPMKRENHEEIKRRFFRCAQVSLRLFLFNVICLKEHLELILDNGMLPEQKLEVMREKIKKIKKVDSLAQFFRLVGDEGNEIERIRFAYINAKKFKYFY